MKYDALSGSTVKIILSEEELREYSLCSENICAGPAETKRNLARLLKRMRLFPGCKAERLFLEAFPRENGGCILYVSSLPAEVPAEKPVSRPCEVMCAVESLSLLIRLCAGLENICGGAKTRVYQSGGGYLLIYRGVKSAAFGVKRLMSEYGTVCSDPVRISSAEETGKLIIGNGAAEKLSALI